MQKKGNFWGFWIIIALAAIIGFSMAGCGNPTSSGGSSDPKIPSALQNTAWKDNSGNELAFAEKSVTYKPASGSSATYLLYESETIEGTLYLRFSVSGRAVEDIFYVSYQNGKITGVYFKGSWIGGTWVKDSGGNPSAITYTVFQTEGVDGLTDTYGLNFFFSASVDSLNLTAADITVGGVASKGTAALTGSGTSRGFGPITVNAAGMATVRITKSGIETGIKEVTVYKAGETAPDITYTITQTGGIDSVADSTGIVFTFSASVDSLNLTATDITVGGVASKGSAALTGSGASRTLSSITVNEAGLATVSIAKNGIEAATKTVIVYKAGQTVPEYWSITWHLDSGTEGTGEYPTLIEKGETLAKPSPDPTKANNTFGGWYADSGLTQVYNFDSPVTADLNLYAKWEAGSQPPVEPPGPNSTLAEKLAWVLNEDNVADGQTYTFEVSADEAIAPHTLTYTDRSNITIQLKGSGGEKIISLSPGGSLFSIEYGVTLVLDNNITLKGIDNNNVSLVLVNGELIMNAGAKITSNKNLSTYCYGGGVYVDRGGTFTMNGGEISGNSAAGSYYRYGGGVYVEGGGTFTMTGGKISGNSGNGGVYVTGTFTMNNGEISGNSGNSGGGVYVTGTFTMNNGEISGNYGNFGGGGGVYLETYGTFTMTGGKISGNSGGGVYMYSGTFTMNNGEISGNDSTSGGGVYVDRGTFTMNNGEISGNSASNNYHADISRGGGVYVDRGTFTMNGGQISGNSAKSFQNSNSGGGGVYLANGSITKTGGIIYGYDPYNYDINANFVKDSDDRWLYDRGHAVYVLNNDLNTKVMRRETTAGPSVNLNSSQSGAAGGWEN